MTPKFLRDLVVTYRANPAHVPYAADLAIDNAERAAAIFLPLLTNQPQEVFAALYLTAQHRVIAYREIARGQITQCQVAPRDVISPGLLVNAVAIVIAHNHPSGDPNPSPDDLVLTKTIDAALRIFEIELLDHLIIGDGSYCSFKETGRI